MHQSHQAIANLQLFIHPFFSYLLFMMSFIYAQKRACWSWHTVQKKMENPLNNKLKSHPDTLLRHIYCTMFVSCLMCFYLFISKLAKRNFCYL